MHSPSWECCVRVAPRTMLRAAQESMTIMSMALKLQPMPNQGHTLSKIFSEVLVDKGTRLQESRDIGIDTQHSHSSRHIRQWPAYVYMRVPYIYIQREMHDGCWHTLLCTLMNDAPVPVACINIHAEIHLLVVMPCTCTQESGSIWFPRIFVQAVLCHTPACPRGSPPVRHAP